jgi:UDP-glucose 4-epimerase
MHVLVTGGAGFIGSNSVDLLLERGHYVRVFDNFYSGHRHNLRAHERLTIVEGDIRDFRALAAATAGVSHVLHLAAQVFVPTSIDDPAFSGAVNIAGFVNVLEAARAAGVERVVYASSAAVYGTPEALPVTEATPPSALSPYALEKLVNDQYAALYIQLYGLSCCGLRYFNVYGPRQDPRSTYSGVVSRFCDRLGRGEGVTVFGDGRQTRDFIAVADVARANLAALERRVEGVVNVATGTSVNLLELIETLSGLVGRPVEITHAPARAGEVRDSIVAPRRLRDALGLEQTDSLETGLRALLDSLNIATKT